jgi:type I restriction enzyme M protein
MSLTRLEASVRHNINTQLDNLGWVLDESSINCNVTQERAKTEEQNRKLGGKRPDYVLYEKNTNKAIGIIEAKKPGQNLDEALRQAEELYARPLDAPLIFAYNDTFTETRFLYNNRVLKIDGEDVKQLVDHYTSLRFLHEGPEILSAPPEINYSREQLIKIFKQTSNLLREAGLQAGQERFSVLSDILFLKLLDEATELQLHAGEQASLPDYLRWRHFKTKSGSEMLNYIKDVIWPAMAEQYGDVFGKDFLIESPDILEDIVRQISDLNLTSADTDIKGDAFEYFLKNAYQGVGIKDLGEYFTPRNVVRTMVSMVDPKLGEKIYDPFCGTGGFLIEAFRYIKLRTKLTPQTEEILKTNTVFGGEITTNARIAKMNMILFGDGHSNLQRHDSFANPQTGKFDIVITNPPYSQHTRHGNLYAVPSNSGDAIAAMHCFDSLNENGRGCLLVKEDFLVEGGDVGAAREYIFRNAKNFSIISLPRKMFEPYTPTKTSIVYFEKKGTRDTTYFYLVKNVGHQLTGRKKPTQKNDLPHVLDSMNEEKVAAGIRGDIVSNDVISRNKYSLWFYDYFEELPKTNHSLVYLGDYIEERNESVLPKNKPDDEFDILGVNNIDGVVFNETLLGGDIKQKYKKVYAGDLVYNPHRVNVGSIGIVPDKLDGKYISNIYVVFHSKDENIMPPELIHYLMKTLMYKDIIGAYDTRHGAVRANLTYDMLCKIKVPILKEQELKDFKENKVAVKKAEKELTEKQKRMKNYVDGIIDKDRNPDHEQDFNALLTKVAQGSGADGQTSESQ